MSEDKHIIWSNYDLDYEDWRGDLETEYPELSEDERISLMYEINGLYLVRDLDKLAANPYFLFTSVHAVYLRFV